MRGKPLIGPLRRVEHEGVQVWCAVCDTAIDGELLNPEFWHPGREPKWWDYQYKYTVYRFESDAAGVTWHECCQCYDSYA